MSNTEQFEQTPVKYWGVPPRWRHLAESIRAGNFDIDSVRAIFDDDPAFAQWFSWWIGDRRGRE